MLHLILQMISVTDRIDLKTARFKFNSLRSVSKIQLPDNLINEIDNTQDELRINAEYYFAVCALHLYHQNVERSKSINIVDAKSK